MILYTCKHGANLLRAGISFGAWDESDMVEGDMKIIVRDENDFTRDDDGGYSVIGFDSVEIIE